MENSTLLPADRYVVINKSVLSDTDRSIIINLYEPLIGALAVSLYFTLWNDLSTNNVLSRDLIHHHLTNHEPLSYAYLSHRNLQKLLLN